MKKKNIFDIVYTRTLNAAKAEEPSEESFADSLDLSTSDFLFENRDGFDAFSALTAAFPTIKEGSDNG